MTNGAGQCTTCGRNRWAGERFCPGCGTEQTDLVTDGTDLVDLDADVEQAAGGSERSSGRESLVGMAALAAIIAVVALLFTLGNNAADELTSPDDPETSPTEEPSAAVAPAATATPRATPVATLQIPLTPRPGSVLPTPTAEPPSLAVERLVKAIIDFDLGDGWLVGVDDPKQPVALNLQSGELVPLATPFLAASQTVLVGEAGLYVLTSAGVVNTWSLLRWDGSASEVAARLDNADFTFTVEPAWYFLDEEVGPVVVHIVDAFAGNPRLHALALATGQSRAIEVDDPTQMFLSAPTSIFTSPGQVLAPSESLLLAAGDTTWRWSFNDGWEPFSPGSVRAVSGRSAITVECTNPSDCAASMIDARSGELIKELASYEVRLPFDSLEHISPDRQWIASFSGRTGPSYDRAGVWLHNTATGEGTRIGRTDFNWWEVLGWSPNSRYLLVDGEAGLAAIDVATDDVHLLLEDEFRGNRGAIERFAFLPNIDR